MASGGILDLSQTSCIAHPIGEREEGDAIHDSDRRLRTGSSACHLISSYIVRPTCEKRQRSLKTEAGEDSAGSAAGVLVYVFSQFVVLFGFVLGPCGIVQA